MDTLSSDPPLGTPVASGLMGIVMARSGFVYPCHLYTVCLDTGVPQVSIPKPHWVLSSVWPGRRRRQDGSELVLKSSLPHCVANF